MSWVSEAERVYDGGGFYLIGEDWDGMFCAPTRRRFPNGERVWRSCVRVPIGRLLSSWIQRKIVYVDLPDSALQLGAGGKQ
jgi:hypothetical protein